MNRLVSILWPAFVVGGAAEVVFFTVVAPQELYFFGEAVELGPLATYTIGFFLFWCIAAASSAFTVFLQKSAEEINRCPLEPRERPPGCPKAEP
ncbi:MAG: hypothetical protein JO035_15135 [Betaproteobacteria bacterium]|nr:hypothetical protein [Betaproteobacteria bacterium]